MNNIRKLLLNTGGWVTVNGVPPLTLKKSKGLPLSEYTIYGHSNGVGNQTINVFKYPYVSGFNNTVNGIKFTTNPDHSITINGTCTSKFAQVFSTDNGFTEDSSLYTLGGCYGGSASTYYFQTHNGFRDVGDGVCVYTKDDKNIIRIYIEKGAVLNNVTVYPMLVEGNLEGKLPAYEPYGYKIPIVSNGKTSNVFLDTQLKDGENIDYATQTITRKDGTKTSINAPEITTAKGTTTIDINTTTKPSNMSVVYKRG